MTYTGRTLEMVTIVERDNDSVLMSSGWSTCPAPEILALLTPGRTVSVETRNFSTITGWLIDDVWHGHKTDDDLAREHAEMIARFAREKQEQLDAHREEWTQREAQLPEWLRERLDYFRERGGDNFDVDGWGYELIICELAAAYTAEDGFADNDTVMSIARREGTSGNQHDMAKALARKHHEQPDESLAGTVSALSPLTGSAFYEASK